MLIRDLPSYSNIKAGRWFLPPAAINEFCAKSVRMILMESREHPDYLGRSGSCTLLNIKGRRVVAATVHSIASQYLRFVDAVHAIRFHSTNDGVLTNLPVDHLRQVTSNFEEEYADIAIFDLAESHLPNSKDRPAFFPCIGFDPRYRIATNVYGYPMYDDVMKYEPLQVDMIQCVLGADFDTEYKSRALHFRRYITRNPIPIADGLSGGAVFSLVGNFGNYEMVFDGVIVRAGGNYVYVVDADFIVKFFNSWKSD